MAVCLCCTEAPATVMGYDPVTLDICNLCDQCVAELLAITDSELAAARAGSDIAGNDAP